MPKDQDTLEDILQGKAEVADPTLFPRKRKRSKRRKKLLLSASFILVLGAAGVFVFYHLENGKLREKLPIGIVQSTPFPIYVPTVKNLQIVKESATVSSNILSFKATIDGKEMTFNEQAKTDEFDLQKFSTADGLSVNEKIEAGDLSAIIGSLRGLDIALVGSPKSIITITCGDTNCATDISQVVRSLKAI